MSGIVEDPEGEPIELASVVVDGTLVGTLTDLKGRYSLKVAKQDSLLLRFSCMGYNEARRTVARLDRNLRLNVRMTYLAAELGEVSVTAFRTQTNTMTTLNAENARLMPDARGGSIEGLISTFAGVSSTNELSSTYNVRGGSYDENLVYVNGVEVYRPLLIRSGQQEGMSFINPDLTGGVQFSSGGFESRYGDKMSSVLDITYKKPESFEGAISASLMGATAYVGSSSDRFTQVTGVRYKSGQSLLNTMETKGEYDPRFMDVQTYMTWDVAPRWEVSLLGNLAHNTYRFSPANRTTSFGTTESARDFTVYYDGGEEDRFATLFGALFLKHQISDRSNIGLQVSGFNSDESESYDIRGEYWLAEAADDTQEPIGVGAYQEHARNRLKSAVEQVTLFGTWYPGQHQLQYGATVQLEQVNDRIKEWEMRDSSGYSVPSDGHQVQMVYSQYAANRIESVRSSFYLQDTWRYRGDVGFLTLNGGVRASYWSLNRELLISPRLSSAFVPATMRNMTLRAAAGIYYQAPFYKELLDTIGVAPGVFEAMINKDIRSPRSIQFILGGDYTFRVADRPFKFTLEGYYKVLDDLIPYTVNNVKIRYYGENCASGFATGLDMKLFGAFVPGVDSWLSLSLMKTQQEIDGVRTPLPTDQRYNLSLNFQDYFPGYKKLRLNLRGVLSDGLPVTPPRKGYEDGWFRTPPYKRVDIGLTYTISRGEDRLMDRPFFSAFKNIYIGVDCFNLIDFQNVNSYLWITDVSNHQYAVPNYLTGRQFNVRLNVEF